MTQFGEGSYIWVNWQRCHTCSYIECTERLLYCGDVLSQNSIRTSTIIGYSYTAAVVVAAAAAAVAAAAVVTAAIVTAAVAVIAPPAAAATAANAVAAAAVAATFPCFCDYCRCCYFTAKVVLSLVLL